MAYYRPIFGLILAFLIAGEAAPAQAEPSTNCPKLIDRVMERVASGQDTLIRLRGGTKNAVKISGTAATKAFYRTRNKLVLLLKRSLRQDENYRFSEAAGKGRFDIRQFDKAKEHFATKLNNGGQSKEEALRFHPKSIEEKLALIEVLSEQPGVIKVDLKEAMLEKPFFERVQLAKAAKKFKFDRKKIENELARIYEQFNFGHAVSTDSKLHDIVVQRIRHSLDYHGVEKALEDLNLRQALPKPRGNQPKGISSKLSKTKDLAILLLKNLMSFPFFQFKETPHYKDIPKGLWQELLNKGIRATRDDFEQFFESRGLKKVKFHAAYDTLGDIAQSVIMLSIVYTLPKQWEETEEAYHAGNALRSLKVASEKLRENVRKEFKKKKLQYRDKYEEKMIQKEKVITWNRILFMQAMDTFSPNINRALKYWLLLSKPR